MEKLAVPRAVVKSLAILVGLPAMLLCCMAMVGLATGNGWARLGVALVITLGGPALLADRLLPDTPTKATKGLASDVFALSWLGFALLVSVVANVVTRPMLLLEADRLAAADHGWLARATYLLAGVDAQHDDAPGAATVATSATAVVMPSSSAAAPAPVDAPPVPKANSASPQPVPVAPKAEDGELSPADIFKRFAPAVVTINVKGERGMGGGTGFLIDANGVIATNFHVIDGASEASIKFMHGALYEDVDVLAEDAQADIALLRVTLAKPSDGDVKDVEPVKLADSDAIVVGERAISIGNPLGLEHTLTTGIVSARRTYQARQWIQMSTPISPGNSGGPVFNDKGAVMGLSTGSIAFGGAQNLNLAVPINVLKAMVKPTYPASRKIGKAGGATRW